MYAVNKFGRSYKPGTHLSEDLRHQVIELSQHGSFRSVGRRLRIQPTTVSKISKQYREMGHIELLPRNHVRIQSKLSFADSLLLETLVNHKGTSSLKEMQKQLNEFGDCGLISLTTISRHVRYKLPSIREYSRKRLGKCVDKRISQENLVYTQVFLDYLSTNNYGFSLTFSSISSSSSNKKIENEMLIYSHQHYCHHVMS